jgi:predicted metalloenzyme YecM
MTFLQRAQDFLLKAEVSIPNEHRSNEQIDHVCYRAESTESYKEVCDHLKTVTKFLTESDVNGRPISCFYVSQGLQAKHNKVHVIEVASPKKGTNYTEGFEHIEIFSKQAGDDFIINGIKIKLCTQSLLQIVQQERWEKFSSILQSDSQNIFDLASNRGDLIAAVKDSKVMDVLKPFHPLICGTFPLGLGIGNSDIDIVCELEDSQSFALLLQKHFQKQSAFRVSKTKDLVICQFRHRDILFEIYAAKQAAKEQNAYVHMLAEAQLLAYTGEWTKDQIIQLKKQGFKTEPAFAKFYGFEVDPYNVLYRLYNQWDAVKSYATKALQN